MKFFLLILFLAPVSVHCQTVFPIDSTTHKITYSDVVAVGGKKDVLYDKALEWFALTFKSSNDVIQLKDKEAGKIIGSWYIYSGDSRLGYVSCNVVIYIKDEKYKYSFSDLLYLGTSEFKSWPLEDDPSVFSVNLMKGAQRKIKAKADQEIKGAIESLKAAMAKPAGDNF